VRSHACARVCVCVYTGASEALRAASSTLSATTWAPAAATTHKFKSCTHAHATGIHPTRPTSAGTRLRASTQSSTHPLPRTLSQKNSQTHSLTCSHTQHVRDRSTHMHTGEPMDWSRWQSDPLVCLRGGSTSLHPRMGSDRGEGVSWCEHAASSLRSCGLTAVQATAHDLQATAHDLAMHAPTDRQTERPWHTQTQNAMGLSTSKGQGSLLSTSYSYSMGLHLATNPARNTLVESRAYASARERDTLPLPDEHATPRGLHWTNLHAPTHTHLTSHPYTPDL